MAETTRTESTSTPKARHPGSLEAAFEEHQRQRPQEPHASAPTVAPQSAEGPAAFKELAETSIEQTRAVYERLKKGADQATAVLEATIAQGSRATDYGRALIQMMHANADAAFDFADELMSAKSFSEMIELSARHARKQLETLADQTKELTALAQTVAADASEPIRTSLIDPSPKDR
jgi:phasin